MISARTGRLSALKPHFWVGISLLLAGHVLIFGRTGGGDFLRPFSDYWFAAVWFGYIFIVDAYLFARDGQSLMVSRRHVFLAMLPLSAAGWWGFEWINSFVNNWSYSRPYDLPDWYANIWSCIFFSTVIPAVWETALLVRGFRWVGNLPTVRGFVVPRGAAFALIALGAIFFVLPVMWPLYFYPLIWGFLALILDPLNFLVRRPSMLGYWSRGDWRVPVSFYVGGLMCGILWEFWNFWAFPKWHYHIPFVGFWHVFEMPLLGYLGYGPFAWEIFTLFWFAVGLVKRQAKASTGLLD